jgi:glutathione S-transferase
MITPLANPIKPTLYHAQFWSSSKPAYILKCLGLTGPTGPISIVDINEHQLKGDAVLTKLNPQRRLPFFYDPDQDLKLNESGGMVEYLLETYDKSNKLWPAPGEPTRPEYLKLLHFGAATGYGISVALMFPKPETEATKKKEWHEIVAPTYEQALDKYGGPFLLGDKFTAADIVAGYDLVTIAFARSGNELLEAHPKVKAYYEHIGQCPIHKELYSCPSEDKEEKEETVEPLEKKIKSN